jgi:hypothetical protein
VLSQDFSTVVQQTRVWNSLFFNHVFVTLRCCRSPSVGDEVTLTAGFPKFLFLLTIAKNFALSLLFLAAAWECSSD